MKNDRLPLQKRNIAAPKRPVKYIPPTGCQAGYYNSSQSFGSQSSSQPEPVSEISISDLVENSERFNPREAARVVEAWGSGEDALAKMPMADQPKALKSKLAWCIERGG